MNALGAPPTERAKAALLKKTRELGLSMARFGEAKGLKWLFGHVEAPPFAAGELALMAAARSGGSEVLELLAERGWAPGKGEDLANLALSGDAKMGEAMRQLSSGSDWRTPATYDGEALLIAAVMTYNVKAVRWLTGQELPRKVWAAAVSVATARATQGHGYEVLEELKRGGRLTAEACSLAELWEESILLETPHVLGWLVENVELTSEERMKMMHQAATAGCIDALRQQRAEITHAIAVNLMLWSLAAGRAGVLEWLRRERLVAIADGRLLAVGAPVGGDETATLLCVAAGMRAFTVMEWMRPAVTPGMVVAALRMAGDEEAKWLLMKWQ